MSGSSTAETRGALGPVGVIVGVNDSPPDVPTQLDGLRRLEAAGHRAAWTNELIGADALVRASLWLGATERLVVGTCIANMWARPPQTAHAAATQLHQAHPGRFVLGLGVGYPQQAAAVGRSFVSPVATARAYLRAMPDPEYPRILGANGPKMLALAGELTDGAMPAGIPPTTTATARETLGADRLLVVFVPISPEDAVSAIADVIGAHRSAGADHVVVGLSYTADFGDAIAVLERLGGLADGSGSG